MPMPALGEILVAMGAVTAEGLRVALANQLIFGGKLGTNLLDLSLVTEEALAAALARKFGCPAQAGEIAVQASALALLTRERVERLDAVPARIVGRRLDVLVADPHDLARLDELAFATGKRVQPIVVPESRLWALMQRHYGVTRRLRALALDLPPPPEPPPEPVRRVATLDHLMDEVEFNALYGNHRAPLAGELVSDDDLLRELQRDAAGVARPRAEPVLPPPRRSGQPLDFAEASAALAGVAEPGAIAHTVLQFAAARFRRAVLLSIHGDLAEGWDGMGEGISSQAVARVRVRVSQPGIVHTVVTTQAHFLGPLVRTPENIALLRALGRGAPRSSFALPILAGGQVVSVLYADGGRGALVDPAGVGELLILATRIAQSHEALLARRR